MWAISCYYNPAGFRRRLDSFREFCRRLDVPLVAVELSFDGRFELGPEDADVVVPLRGGAMLWQKERLLNVAWAYVPKDCHKIAWLDGDIFFENSQWVAGVEALLEDYPLVVPFSRVAELRRDTPIDSVPALEQCDVGFSMLHRWRNGGIPEGFLHSNMRLGRTHSGLAWAARREAFEGIGFYDACIAGSGNRAMLCAALGRPEDAVQYLRMNARWAEHYRRWAAVHYERTQGSIGVLDATLFHLWHGDLAHRRYAERHCQFAAYDFDPACDIGCADGGAWQWTSDKPAMHDFLRRYFAQRREDG